MNIREIDVGLNSISKISNDIAADRERIILEQLNDLISRDLLVVVSGPVSLVRSFDSPTVQVMQTVSLQLKDKEYIEKLEAEVASLKKCYLQMADAAKEMAESLKAWEERSRYDG